MEHSSAGRPDAEPSRGGGGRTGELAAPASIQGGQPLRRVAHGARRFRTQARHAPRTRRRRPPRAAGHHAGPPSRGPAWRAAPAFCLVLVVVLHLASALADRALLPVALPHLPGAAAPPRGVEASDRPLGTPPAVTPSERYRLHPSPDPDQAVVAYDPCRPVHYVVRPDHAPEGSEELVAQAVTEVSAATGLRFVHDGPTTEAPGDRRDTYQPGRYGKRWAPVLIAWSEPGENPGLAGDVVGLGGSSYAKAPGGTLVYVAGQVTLDAPDMAKMLQHPGGTAQVRAIIMHELGHVVGLDHVDDPTQLMHADNVGVTGFADGDRAGLARLGAGACVPQL